MRVVVVGGGISGLIAGSAARRRGHAVTVLEPGELGGEFLAGGLKYVHSTPAMTALLDAYGIAHSDYLVQGGILLSGSVEKYPGVFKSMTPEQGAAIRHDHYLKTRRCAPSDFGERSMNDPGDGRQSRRALRLNFMELINSLATRKLEPDDGPLEVRKARLVGVQSAKNRVVIEDLVDKSGMGPRYLPYDYLVMTIPLWIAKSMCDFYVPEARAMILNVFTVKPIGLDQFVKWDYVYTPYTPGGAVHRVAPFAGMYMLEVNGDIDKSAQAAMSDIAWLFPGGYNLVGIKQGLKGHLLPLGDKVAWPSNVLGLGRYATWNPRSTIDTVLDEASGWFASR